MNSNVEHNSLGIGLLVFVLLTIVDVFLAGFAVVAASIPGVPGVSTFYFAVVFMIASTLWFGAWGAIAAYIGCFIGGILSGIPASVSLYWALADLWQVLIPLIAFSRLHADIGLKTRRDFAVFLAFGWMVNNLVGAAWGAAALVAGGIISSGVFPGVFATWFTSNLAVTIIFTPLLLRFLTPSLQETIARIKGHLGERNAQTVLAPRRTCTAIEEACVVLC